MASPGLGASDPTLGFHADVFHGTFLHMAAVDPDRTLGTGGHRDHRAVLAIGTLVEVGLSAMRAIANDEPPSAQKARKVKRGMVAGGVPEISRFRDCGRGESTAYWPRESRGHGE